MDLTIPADNKVKINGSQKREKYLDLSRELKKLWNMKVTMIPIVIGALGIIPKCLVKLVEDLKIRGQLETIRTKVLLRSFKILSWFLET